MMHCLSPFPGNLSLVMALVANKCDLEAKREVENEVLQQLLHNFTFAPSFHLHECVVR